MEIRLQLKYLGADMKVKLEKQKTGAYFYQQISIHLLLVKRLKI